MLFSHNLVSEFFFVNYKFPHEMLVKNKLFPAFHNSIYLSPFCKIIGYNTGKLTTVMSNSLK